MHVLLRYVSVDSRHCRLHVLGGTVGGIARGLAAPYLWLVH